MITYHTIIRDIPQQYVILLRDVFMHRNPQADRIPQHTTVIVHSGDQQLAACVMPRPDRKEAAA